MRWQAACLALAVGCADWQRPPLTAPYRADQPLIQEQALLGLAPDASAAAVQLVDAEGAPPRLELIALDARGGATRHLVAAADGTARAVARRLRAEARKAIPLLSAVVAELWPEALALAASHGFSSVAPAPPARSGNPAAAEGEIRGHLTHLTSNQYGVPEFPDRLAGRREWSIVADAADDPSALVLRVRLARGDPPAFILLLGPAESGGEAVELARQPISGTPIEGDLWQTPDVIWFLSGSVGEGEPLRRAVGLRRGSLRRGNAELHDRRGLSLRAARDLAGALREFQRAIAADPRYVQALFDAASTAAAAGHDEEAVALLKRAAEVDRRRVEVMGRVDQSLQALRRRADVQEILGMKRPPP